MAIQSHCRLGKECGETNLIPTPVHHEPNRSQTYLEINLYAWNTQSVSVDKAYKKHEVFGTSELACRQEGNSRDSS